MTSPRKPSKETFTQAFLKGISIGAVLAPVLHIFDKPMFELRENPKFSYKEAIKAAFHKQPLDGLSFAFAGCIFKNAILFPIKSGFEKITGNTTWSGFFAGTSCVYVTNFLNVSKWQRYNKKSVKECLELGPKELAKRGVHTAASRNGVYAGTFFETRKILLENSNSNIKSEIKASVAGGIAATAAVVTSTPLDVVLSGIRTHGNSFCKETASVYAKNGAQGFFRGLRSSMGRMAVSGAITSVGMEIWENKNKNSL